MKTARLQQSLETAFDAQLERIFMMLCSSVAKGNVAQNDRAVETFDEHFNILLMAVAEAKRIMELPD
jgi:hypothetical protein